MRTAAGPATPRHFDVQDALLLAGFLALETGIGLWSVPAALIAAGLLCFGFAVLIEVAKGKEERIGTPQS